MKISFCTACMGRAHHLQKTLRHNLRQNIDIEGVQNQFVVLNYGDHEDQYTKLRSIKPEEVKDFHYRDLHEFMTTDPEMVAAIESGRILYARTEKPIEWHMSHAKNMVHRLATGDVVCNLDADNYTGPKFGEALARFFKNHPEAIISPSHSVSRNFPPEERGFFGRIALPRKFFEKLGGYDESFEGWGAEDTDFARRARMIGLKYYRFEDLDFLKIIAHGNDMRAQNMYSDEERRKAELQRISGQMHETFAQKYYRAAIDRLHMLIIKPIAANSGTHFGLGHVKVGLKEEALEIAPLRGSKANAFNEVARVRGYYELVKARISPRIINLK